MFVHYRTRGIVIKKEERGESDLLFTIYTKDFGKLEILGKAIRKISSKLRAGAEIFYLSDIEFIQGKAHKTLIDATAIEKFGNLRNSLKRLRVAHRVSEVLDNLIRGQEPDEKIWQLISETFIRLNNPNLHSETFNLQYFYFFWNFLSVLGYGPELYNCVLCQKKLLPENLYFSGKEGGIICRECFEKNKSGRKITPEAIKILRIISKRGWGALLKLKIEPEYLKELKLVSEEYYRYILCENSPSF